VPPTSAKLAQEHLTIFDWQHQVDHHQIRKLDRALRERRRDVTRRDDSVAILLEYDLKHVSNRWVVIENEDRLLQSHPCIVTGGVRIANMRSLPTSELLPSPRMALAPHAKVAALCVVAACAGQSGTHSPPAAFDPSEFYPLQAGNAWSYDVDTGEARTTLGITRVESFDGRIATVQTGRAVVRYEVLPEGIRVPPDDAWLIRGPLAEGATWPGRGGRSARLTSLEVRVDTPAGKFERCIEVVETGGKLDLEVSTVYCPRVGPVTVASTMRSNTSDRVAKVSARLSGFDVSLSP